MLTPRTDPFRVAIRVVSDLGTGGVGVWGAATGVDRLPRPYGLLHGSSPESNSIPTPVLEDSDSQPEFDDDPRLARMRAEAVLLLAKTPLSTRKLAQLAGLADGTEARTMIRGLNQTYEEQGRALRIEKIAGGFRMVTRPGLAPWLRRLGHVPPPLRLSPPMLETLAVVAYRQPVSRADTEAVRGVACGELLRQLMEKDLIRMTGRSEELGRPYLYGTTKRFLQLFGLTGTDALPSIDWQTVQEDQAAELLAAETADQTADDADASTDPTPRDSTTSPKEPVVSTALASPPVPNELAPNEFVPNEFVPSHLAPLDSGSNDSEANDVDVTRLVDGTAVMRDDTTVAVIEDEEDDLYEGVTDDDDDEEVIDDDEFSDDWDDDDDDEVDDDDSDEDDDLDEDDDDSDDDDEEESDDWEEVGDDDDDDDWDEGEEDDEEFEEGDESSEDDEDWSE